LTWFKLFFPPGALELDSERAVSGVADREGFALLCEPRVPGHFRVWVNQNAEVSGRASN
jgi:hypothetical protein